MSPLVLLLLTTYNAKLQGPAFVSALLVCLVADLRVSAEMFTQFLGVLSWLGWS